MKILSIKIKNLASIEGEFEIDFTKEPLFSAGIFAITGPTGAGKSTILDALCLALFAKTPRHALAKEVGIRIIDVAKDKISLSDVKGILRKGTAEGFAEVAFIGVDGIKYKAIWSVKRSRNKIDGSLQDDTVDLVNLDNLTKYPEKKAQTLKQIEKVLGLNFEQFTRSVLLAQGDFTAFLRAEKKEKSSLLEKLTGTDIYSEISKKVYQKTKNTDLDVKLLEEQIKGIKLLTNEEKQKYNDTILKFIEKLNKLNLETNHIIEDLGWYATLKNITEQKNVSEHGLNLALQKKKDAKERIIKYNVIEKIQPSKIYFTQKNQLQIDFEKTKKERELTEKNIYTLYNEKEKVRLQYEKTLHIKKTKELEYSSALPHIELAKELDTRIKEVNKQVVDAQEAAKKTTEQKQAHIVILNQKQDELNNIKEKIQDIKHWKDKNQTKQPVAENKDVILSKLEDAKKLLDKEIVIAHNIKNNQQKLKVVEKEIVTYENKLKEEEALKQKYNDELNTINTQLSIYNIENLRAAETQIHQDLQNTIAATGFWEIFYRQQLDLKQCNTQLKTLKTDQENNNILYVDIETQKRSADIQQQLSYKLLNKARLEVSKNVVSLRLQLNEDEECPVCGSTNHPYIQNHVPLNILAQLEEEFEIHKNNYENLLKQSSSLEQQIKNIENQLLILYQQEKELSVVVIQKQQEWQTFVLLDFLKTTPDNEKLTVLKKTVENMKQDSNKYKLKIEEYEVLHNQQTLLKQNVDTNTLSLTNNSYKLNEQQIVLQNIHLEINRLTEEKKDINKNITEITNLLHPFFSNPDWQENWVSSPINFIQILKTFAEEWNAKNKNLEIAIQSLNNLNIVLDGLFLQLEQHNNLEKTANQNLQIKSREYASISNQRKGLFYNKPVFEVEHEYKAEIDLHSKLAEDYRINLETFVGEEKEQIGKLNEINKQLLTIQNNLQLCNEAINNYIVYHNKNNKYLLDEQILLEFLNISASWIETEKNAIQTIENNINEATVQVNLLEQQYSQHLKKKKTDKEEVELINSQLVLKTELEQLNKEKNDVDFILRQDIEDNKKVGSIFIQLNELKRIQSIRQKLNDLIGSADGEKFRQIAQEYTLDILLGYANKHLKELASRYELKRIEDTLALQVVDKDMGDEIRSVHSLSGGESFLVSLALALGLASLSSNKMKVESLFIDEGFGSLDAATLSIAMDALEQLQNQGRKVGVISHVREMTERIHTQVRVLKLSNGKSRLEVMG